MRRLPVFLAEWLRLALRSDWDELDLQINKLRALRDSYKAPDDYNGKPEADIFIRASF